MSSGVEPSKNEKSGSGIRTADEKEPEPEKAENAKKITLIDLVMCRPSTSGCKPNLDIASSGYKSKLRKASSSAQALNYKHVSTYVEDHHCPIFCVQFNHFVKGVDAFACAGINQVHVYQCLFNGKLKMLQAYADPDTKEKFYTCAWSFDDKKYEPLLAVAGERAIIRILSISNMSCVESFIGHTHEINELKFHPDDGNLLLSASRDHTVRLWNIKTSVCVAIFGGDGGHRDAVLSVDFDISGKQFFSCGVDHALKMWRMDKEEVKTAVKMSYDFKPADATVSFPSHREHFPDYTTRDIHANYIDCVRWFGDFIISKDCVNELKFWKPQYREVSVESNPNATLIHTINLDQCDLLFLKFSMDYSQKLLALGNRTGKLMVWHLDVSDPKLIECKILTHPRCLSTVRHCSFNRSGSILIAVCDDGSICRWDRSLCV